MAASSGIEALDRAAVAAKGINGFPTGLSLGAPRHRPNQDNYVTAGGVEVTCEVGSVDDASSRVEALITALDEHKGVLLSSSYEFPGRYARWTVGFIDPPIEVAGTGSSFTVRALNERGMRLLPAFWAALSAQRGAGGSVGQLTQDEVAGVIEGTVAAASGADFAEEDRSRQPSLFSVVRSIVQLFSYEGDPQLGLYGAFGYDLTFQFEPIEKVLPRDPGQKDILLYLPDAMLIVDQDKRDAWTIQYDFAYGGRSTAGLARSGSAVPYTASATAPARDTPAGAYSKKVDVAREEFRLGNLFEAVLSQTFKAPCKPAPSEVFRRLRRRNPSPYGFLINLGLKDDGNGAPPVPEYLVGASPEMFVRCEATKRGIRVETCPISGTIARGANALEDAAAVRALLASSKEESELTMCTDVDRNDKSRICEPGSVRVLGRRQIEMYSKLIHTVDHVEGYLRPGFDALDAFLCHTWAVTVTGAPKTWAIQFIERQEASARAWYGGAVGLVGFDGHLNTGLTLRTVRIVGGVAEVRAGATLLYDSEPSAEEAETELKASAMIDAVIREDPPPGSSGSVEAFAKQIAVGKGKNILLIDHQDSFVHTLGNYLRQTGAEVTTVRAGAPARRALDDIRMQKRVKPDLAVLSPGPGNPRDFDLSGTLTALETLRIPGFGVCLGLQGMVEHWGGTLGVLGYPMHGKPSTVALNGSGRGSLRDESVVQTAGKEQEDGGLFAGVPTEFEVARYHSLHGLLEHMPSVLRPLAATEDGCVMALEHTELPYAAVQFHPESILTDPKVGLTILANCLKYLKYADDSSSSSSSSSSSISG